MNTVKRLGAFFCTLSMIVSLLAVGGISASAYTGGGQAGTGVNLAFGCDLSSWNVNGSALNYSLVNFEKMKADGCEFAILRMGYEGSASRTNALDASFLEMYRRARAAGMKLGVYFYSLAYSYDAAVEDAQWAIKVMEDNDLYFEYPIYYDVEDPGSSSDSTRPGHSSLTSTQITQICLGWADTMAAAGYFPGCYGTGSTVVNKLQSSYTSKYDVWYARVMTDGHGDQYDPTTREYSSICGMWQYAWYDYNFDGVSLDFLDVDVAYKDYPSIIVPQGLNRCTQEQEQPPAVEIIGGGQAGTGGIKAKGCDISSWNVDGANLDYSLIDFQKMYDDGCEYVIMRMGYEGSATRKNTLDLSFVEQYRRARQVEGLKIGVYFYSLGYSYDAAVEDAQWAIDIFEQYDMYFEYPIYYDVEDPGSDTDATRPGHYSLSGTQLTQICLGWADTMAAAGYFPGMYAGYEIVSKLQSSYTDKYDVWFAKVLRDGHGTQYVPEEYDYSGICGMWQYAWYDYNFDGVSLDFLDVDVAYKDYPSIIVSQGLNRCQKETVEELTSDTYTVSEQYVSRVPIGTTVSQARAMFREDASVIAFYSANGSTANDDEAVVTGMTVAIVEGGAIKRAYTIAVIGDISGTGKMSSATVRELLLAVASGNTLDPLFKLAADYDGDDTVSTTDARRMLSDLVAA